MNIIGISAFYHDSAACLVKDNEVIFAAQEERFTRKKHDEGFPLEAIKECIKAADGDIDLIAYYESPSLKSERQKHFIDKGLGHAVLSPDTDLNVSSAKELLKPYFDKHFPEFAKLDVFECKHHTSHAAAAYYPSPYDSAAILTLDGVGEWETLGIFNAKGNNIEQLGALEFPNSLGLLYAAITDYCGFKVNSGEYKLMGLAPYGEPKFHQLILDNLVSYDTENLVTINQEYFSYVDSPRMTNEKLHELFGARPRRPDQRLTQKYMDIAASIQSVTEEIVIFLANHVKNITGAKNLCMGGGVALNCVANGKILKEKIFDNIWIQPAAGDAGNCVGAAFLAYLDATSQLDEKSKKTIKPIDNSYLGTEHLDADIESLVKETGYADILEIIKYDNEDDLVDSASSDLKEGLVCGWFQGRMEFGPRALGARSILGNPMLEKTQTDLNLKIKFRESFRPFAPMVKEDKAQDYFDIDSVSPYMLVVAPVQESIRLEVDDSKIGLEALQQKRSTIPAVTHVDYSARVQTVNAKQNPRVYKLLDAFEQKTGCAVLVNTSFNVRGEPIVCEPMDAIKCFLGTNMDTLYINDYCIRKTTEDTLIDKSFSGNFEAD